MIRISATLFLSAIACLTLVACGGTASPPTEDPVLARNEVQNAREDARQDLDALIEEGQTARDTPIVTPSGQTPVTPIAMPDPVATDMLNILTPEEVENYISGRLLTDYPSVLTAIDRQPDTPAADRPSGSANYAGFLDLTVSDVGVSTRTIGEMTLEIDLTTGALSGVADAFVGSAQATNGERSSFVHYDGTINASNGTIKTVENQVPLIDFEIDGTLNNGVNTFSVTGNMVGAPLGDTGEGFGAVAFKSDSLETVGQISSTIDGQPLSSVGNNIAILSAVRE